MRQTQKGLKEEWALPGVSLDFVRHIEHALDIYAEAADHERAVVCFDEILCNWLREFVSLCRQMHHGRSTLLTSTSVMVLEVCSWQSGCNRARGTPR